MSSEQPKAHPQRCETCEHREIVHNHGMGTHRPRCKITKWFLDAYAPTTIEHDFIDKLGCASHSSASEPMPAEDCDRCRFVKDCTPLYVPPCYNGAAVEAAKQARADVLDAISVFIDGYSHCVEDGQDYVSVIAIQNLIESLRQQGGKP